jgi:signal transduction histidine kinase
MLAHSRGGSSDWRFVDINALVEESINLAYHGARATDPTFEIMFERDLDENIQTVEIVPQDISRVLLNLISNSFHATQERKHQDSNYQPMVKVITRDEGDHAIIKIYDNGIGIPKRIRDKIFTPFFTTKPVGEGTGLGLSLSYDIVVHEHHGSLNVASSEGEYTEFTISLPRQARHADSSVREQ